MFTSENKKVRRLKRSRFSVEFQMWPTRTQFMGRPQLDMSDIIDSIVDHVPNWRD